MDIKNPKYLQKSLLSSLLPLFVLSSRSIAESSRSIAEFPDNTLFPNATIKNKSIVRFLRV